MKESKQLRDYQQEMLVRLSRAWRKHRSVMVQMPTGTGKTHLMAEVVRNYADDNVLIVAHRRELIEQIKETLAVFSIGTGEENSTVIVESTQKLSRHIDEISIKPKLVSIDEAHHALAKTYRLLWEKWPKVRFL
ncbi:MAG: DEAD/DEAH box helicase family protein, partial [Prevotella sp.]|nr:DEAD/DEAH box helicase family protein [Prevotella sp.]